MIPANSRFVAFILFLLSIPLAAGCRDDRRHQATEVTTLETKTGVVASDAPPVEVTRALLARLSKAQHSRARGLGVPANRDEYLSTMAEVRGLAARASIFETYRGRGGAQVPADLKEDGAVRVVTESWVSICAHYADQLPSATIAPLAVSGTLASVVADLPAAPASNPHHPKSTNTPTRIVIRLLVDSSNSWKVNRIDLESTSTTLAGQPGISQPISRPATTQSAAQPAG